MASGRPRIFRAKQKIYVFQHDYGDRVGLVNFVLDVSNSFDRHALTGLGVAVNNNIYELRCYIFLAFENASLRFEEWLCKRYPAMRHVPNTFTSDFLADLKTAGYNIATFVEGQDDSIRLLLLSSGDRALFAWPSRSEFANLWGSRVYKDLPHVFLCHSSKDKGVVDDLFEELQRHQVHAWYDKYEIELGDDVVAKIEQGLDKCPCGIIVISHNAIAPSASWPKAERTFLTDEQIRQRKKIVCLNIDLSHDEVPPLLRRLRYQLVSEPNALRNIAASIKRHLDRLSATG